MRAQTKRDRDMTEANEVRTCTKCGKKKLASEFTWRDAAHTRKRAQCKECERENKYARKKPNGTSPRYEYHSRYYLEHRLEIKDKAAQRYLSKRYGNRTCKDSCKNYPCFKGIDNLESNLSLTCRSFVEREKRKEIDNVR